MNIDCNSIVFVVSQYAAPYAGNFISSFVALEQSLHCSVIYVFPQAAKLLEWMTDFMNLHTVYFIANNPDDSVHELERLFAEYKPDIVHCNFDGYDIPVVKAAGKTGNDIHVVWHLHDHLGYLHHPVKRLYQKYMFWKHYGYYGRNVSIIAVSDEVLGFVNGFLPEYILQKVIPNGIDLARLGNLQVYRYNKPNVFTFLAYGGWNVQKRIDLLVCAAKRLLDKGRNFKIIVTQGTDTQMVLESLIPGGDSWIELIEQTDDIIGLFMRASCFVSTSVAETFSYAIAEASIWGLPVIQSDIKGTMWNAGNPSSFLFKSCDIEDLERTMEKVMDMDSNKLMDMCAITQNNNVREYSLGAWVAKVIDFYSEI